ncbi:MAG: hypothetical protein N3A68_08245 [Bacteroidia bacterium]|nr:hypothetical protein [Bacteroidia bacterium]
MSWGIWMQVALWGGWGGHTSTNDLTVPAERWTRFYGLGAVGVRFLPDKRLQPGLHWEGGRFISQDRSQGKYSQTRWNAIALTLRLRPLQKKVSPVGEIALFRLNAWPRNQEDKALPGSPASVSVNGIGWGAGLSWRMHLWAELALLYVRRRPQTSYLEGVNGPGRDRIEGFIGQISFILQKENFNRSRFQ